MDELNDSYEKKKKQMYGNRKRKLPSKIKLLFNVAKDGDPTQLASIGRYRKEEVNAKDESGLTPLYYAIINFRFDMVQWLCKNKADVNIRLGNSNTAAHEAFISNHLVIIQLVLNARPPPNLLIENINDMSPLDYATPRVMRHFDAEFKL